MKTKLVLFFLLLYKITVAQDNESATKYLDSLGKPATKETFYRYQVFQKLVQNQKITPCQLSTTRTNC